jgi:hypothetical protein
MKKEGEEERTGECPIDIFALEKWWPKENSEILVKRLDLVKQGHFYQRRHLARGEEKRVNL